MFKKNFAQKILLILGLLIPSCIYAASMLVYELGNKPEYDSLRSSSEGKEAIGALKIMLKDPLNKRVLNRTLDNISEDSPALTRGVKDTYLYNRTSPGVVLVVTNDHFGSGIFISKKGDILTNFHVVDGYETVGVVFKKGKQDSEITPQDVRTAKIIRIDEISDLALIRVSSVPVNVNPLKLGSEKEIQVGANVHAIGHPTGEAWTYTKGIISQTRKNYEWVTNNKQHMADVIQTQTPINTGNSGGPLLSDLGSVIGINSFKVSGSEGINFAVSVTDLKRFLNRDRDRYASVTQKPAQSSQQTESCQPKILGEKRSNDDTSTLIFYDLDCDGKPDAYLKMPDDVQKPITLNLISRKTGRVYGVIVSLKRDGKWDYSLWDIDDSGKPGLIGYHDDGGPKPTRYEKWRG